LEVLERRLLLSAAVWESVGADALLAAEQSPGEHVSYLRAEQYELFALDTDRLRSMLAPSAGGSAERDGGVSEISIPRPDGTLGRFQIAEAPVMAPGLAARYPEIRTYRGQGLDDPAAVARLDITPAGFHAQVLSPDGAYYVDPYWHLADGPYASYYRSDCIAPSEGACLLGDQPAGEVAPVAAGSDQPSGLSQAPVLPANVSSGTELRTYRLAVAATGEYTAFHGGTVLSGQAAIVTAVNRVTGIYESELAISLELIDDNDDLVYTDAATDPYTNDSPSDLLNENQANIDAEIGDANYDIGHVFTTGGGGLASLAVVGITGSKARGETGRAEPTGDVFWVDYVAHEMGHQFGGNHTFNGIHGQAGTNRWGSTAYEPGSGSTIMAYAGICGADDLQDNSDAYFHAVSFDEIIDHADGTIPGVGTRTATGNTVPTVSAGSDYTIPADTPFALTAVGNDGDGDLLTYCWEEMDLGPAQAASDPDNGSSPIFRSWLPTTTPTRTFPRLSDLLDNTTVLGEQLPSTNRDLNFRVTVRDNRAGGGGVNSDDMVVTVVDTGSAFQVTSPNTPVTWEGLSTQTITWTVAGTTGSGIDTASVDIRLSTDGGNTFAHQLASNTPNDGSQSVSLPSVDTTVARIKVEGRGNVFFDVSDVNFTITEPKPDLYDDGETWSNFNPDDVNGGQAWQCDFDVRNGGSVDSGAFNADFYASINSTISTGDYYLGTTRLTNVPAGNWAHVDLSLAGFPNIPSGTYYVGVIYDADGEVDESNEFNNIGVDTDDYPLTVTQTPDLRGNDFHVLGPTIVTAGQTLTIQYALTNDEPAAAGPFDVSFYVSTDTTITTGDYLLGVSAIAGLGGNSKTGLMSKTVTLPGVGDPFYDGDGWYGIGMVVDSGGDVTEFDETNNASVGFGIDWDENYILDDAYEQNDVYTDAFYPGVDWEGKLLSSIDGMAAQFDEDWYRIDVTSGEHRVTADCTFTHADGDITLSLHDAGGTMLAVAAGTKDDEHLEHVVPPGGGTFYLRVFQGNGGNAYDLSWHDLGDDDYEQNDTRGSAFTGLGENTWLSTVSGPGVQADDDWYRIVMTENYERLAVNCTFHDIEGNIDVEVYDDVGALITGSYSATDNEIFEFGLPGSGTYYLRVIGPDNGQGYDLWWDDLQDDLYEENDVAADAYGYSNNERTWLSKHKGWAMQFDEDWYRIYMNSGYDRLVVDVAFSHAEGNLDVHVYDEAGFYVTGSTTTTDDEHIDFGLPASGAYYDLRIVGPDNGQTYDLWWDDLRPPDLLGVYLNTIPDWLGAAGQTTTTFRVQNQGPGDAEEFALDFYLSEDDTITVADTLLTTHVVDELAAGLTYEDTVVLDLPDPDPFRTDNRYYVGMIVNPAPGEVNQANNANQGLFLDMDDIASERNLPSPSTGTSVNSTTIALDTPVLDSIGTDEWIGGYDVDVFRFVAPATQRVGFDIDQAAGSGLDSYMQLYNALWTVLAQNQTGTGPAPEPGGGDPYIEWNVAAGQTYYVAVRGFGGGASDPRSLAGRALSTSTGDYEFTVAQVITPTPGAPDLLPGSDTGINDDDNITMLNNSEFGKTLQFSVNGTVFGATVRIYAGGTEIGSAVAGGATTTVTTNGSHDLPDGAYAITARQEAPDMAESVDSPAMTPSLVVDTVAPTVETFGLSSGHLEWRIGIVDSTEWTAGRPYATAPWSTANVVDVGFDEAVWVGLGDMTMTGIDAGALAILVMAGGAPTVHVQWKMAGTAGGYFDKDRYEVALGAGVIDIAGNSLGGWSFDLAVLPGDINGDGEVGSLDRRDLRNAYGSEIGHEGYSVLVDVNGDGSAGSLDRRVLRNHYAESLPVVPASAAVGGVTPGGAVLVAGSSAMRTFTTADGRTVTAEWSAARETWDGAAQRGVAPSAAGVPFASSSWIPVAVSPSASEESRYRHVFGLRPALEPVPVFFSSDVSWAVLHGGGLIVIDEGMTPNEAQLEPDLRAGLDDPLTAAAINP